MNRLWSVILVGAFVLAGAASSYSQDEQTNTPAPNKEEPGQNQEKQAPESGHKFHVRLGTVTVGAGYTHYAGPLVAYPYGYPYGYGYYPYLFDPYWSYYAPFYRPGYFAGFQPGDNKGQVKLSAPSTAEVRIDGAYAGTADNLKNFWLDPGAYDLSVTGDDGTAFHQRIYVLSGKTLKIVATLSAENSEVKP